MFEGLPNRESRPLAWLRRVTIFFVGAFLILGAISAYRAWVQVRQLDLKASEQTLRNGSTVETAVLSSGRATVDVRLELIQETRTKTLGVLHLRGNEFGFLDPRSKQASQKITIDSDVLTRFQPGEAQLRATAVGRPQWGRTPPPVIRELRVDVSKL